MSWGSHFENGSHFEKNCGHFEKMAINFELKNVKYDFLDQKIPRKVLLDKYLW